MQKPIIRDLTVTLASAPRTKLRKFVVNPSFELTGVRRVKACHDSDAGDPVTRRICIKPLPQCVWGTTGRPNLDESWVFRTAECVNDPFVRIPSESARAQNWPSQYIVL